MNDIIRRIQQGEAELISVLWDLCADTVRIAARKRYRKKGGSGGLDASGNEVSDYIQAGYIAVAEAAAKFDTTGEVPFLAYLQKYFLRKEFQVTSGMRSEKQRADLLRRSVRFDDLSDDDRDYLELVAGDEDTEEAATDPAFRDGLRQQLLDMVGELPPDEAEEIRAAFFDGKSAQERADDIGVTVDEIRRRRARGIDHLRGILDRTRKGKQLQRYIDEGTNFSLHVGIQQFRSTHTSSVEALAEIRDRNLRRLTGKTE